MFCILLGLAGASVDLVNETGAKLDLDTRPTTRAKDLLKNKAVYTLARINEGEVEQLTFEVPEDP
jgi:hypothetical protein